MRDLSLHIFDVAENAIRAGAKRIEILVDEDQGTGMRRVRIVDDGHGMPPEMAARATDPFVTSRTERPVGLGLALLRQASEQALGVCRVESVPGNGTAVEATFNVNHIDCKPLGDLGQTLTALIACNPNIEFMLETLDGRGLRRLDTRDLRKSLGDHPISSAPGITCLGRWVREGLESPLAPPDCPETTVRGG